MSTETMILKEGHRDIKPGQGDGGSAGIKPDHGDAGSSRVKPGGGGGSLKLFSNIEGL